jgi:hypothetical protein
VLREGPGLKVFDDGVLRKIFGIKGARVIEERR